MRIQLPFNIPFEIVGHRPGQPVVRSDSSSTVASVVLSHLPIKLQRSGRPAWGHAENFRTGDAVVAAPSEAVIEEQQRAARRSSVLTNTPAVQSTNQHEANSVSDQSAAVVPRPEEPSTKKHLAQNLAALAAWAKSGPRIERQERRQVATEFRKCWVDPQVVRINIFTKNRITSFPPIPAKLTELHVWDCASIVTLPVLAGHSQLKRLDLRRLYGLRHFPDVSNCVKLKFLVMDECHDVEDPAELTGCRQLELLKVARCTNLRALPAMSECPGLETLDISFCGGLAIPIDLSKNPNITKLFIWHCGRINALNLTGCNQLKSISLTECAGLATIPSVGHLQQLEFLDLGGTPLTSLPDDIVSMPGTCRAILDASRLSDAVRNRLIHIMNAPGYTGPQITYSMGQASSDFTAPPVAEAVAAWRAEALPQLQQALTGFDWSALPLQDNVHAFSSFLVRARETNDYSRAAPELKAATQQRVAALLVQMQNDPALRENCFNLATDAVNSCGDRVALRMLDMENCAVISEAKTAISAGKYDHNPQALIDLCKGQHRLDIIAKGAESKVATMHFTDPIEVHLGYLTKLSDSYRLPLRISSLLYPACSGVTVDDLAAVSKKCSNDGLSPAECATNDRAYQHALATSDLMRGLLERLQPAQMQAANVETDRQIGQAQHRLYEELDTLDPTAANFAQQNRQLKTAFDAIETDIKVRATLPVLQSFLQKHQLDNGLGNT